MAPRGQNRIRPFLRGRNITFPIAIDADGSVMQRMQVRALPTTILIAPDREIVLREAGLSDGKAIIAALEVLLPEKEAPEEKEASEQKKTPKKRKPQMKASSLLLVLLFTAPISAQITITGLTEMQRGEVPGSDSTAISTAYNQVNIDFTQKDLQAGLRAEIYNTWGRGPRNVSNHTKIRAVEPWCCKCGNRQLLRNSRAGSHTSCL